MLIEAPPSVVYEIYSERAEGAEECNKLVEKFSKLVFGAIHLLKDENDGTGEPFPKTVPVTKLVFGDDGRLKITYVTRGKERTQNVGLVKEVVLQRVDQKEGRARKMIRYTLHMDLSTEEKRRYKTLFDRAIFL